MPLPTSYDPKTAEKRWQQEWLKNGVYHFRDDLPREQTFVIDTPPPTVSGVLHMGHIFSYTQADIVARYQRMSGRDVFYPMGFDDNGLPTERLVEKIKGVRATQMSMEPGGREKFAELCREVVKEAEDEFRALFQSVALSVDWRREYQTVSDEVIALSQRSFLDLLEKGEAYRAFRPTYWDWVDQTAIAQAEIEDKELPGVQITIPFGIMDYDDWKSGQRPAFETLKKLHVMTTRPELLGACVGLICHPSYWDELSGKIAITPLFNYAVPIASDAKVELGKGTGFVMCCSWGDDTDKEWINHKGLAWRPLLQPYGNGKIEVEYASEGIKFHAGRNGAYTGADYISAITKDNCLDVNKAANIFRQLEGAKLIRDIKHENSAKGRVIKLLEEAGLLIPQGEKQELIIQKTQTVKCAERSGTPIEIIPTHQWFVRITDKKEALLEKGAECQWHPEYMRIRLNQWIEGLKEDWCISRQRFFGVPFPVWYSKREGEEGKPLYAEPDQLPVDPLTDLPKGYARAEVTADKDVMDTWATSSISPQINAGTLEKCKLFPADLRPQAHEIIRTWAFYTIVKAHLHANTIPWQHLMISGWCLAADKTKMSKSKGNVVTPVALIEEKGADAVRYWTSTSRLGADTAFSEDVLKIGKKLVTKLWNASQLVARVLDTNHESRITNHAPLDRWILTRLHRAVAKATEEFERFEYADARAAIEDFFWNDFCDNYLELVKARAYGEIAEGQDSAIYTLRTCLHTILRLFAPVIPHVTEEIYSHLFAEEYAAKGSLHARGQWPKAEAYPKDEAAEAAGQACVEILNLIRKAKSEANVSIKYPVERVTIALQQKDVPGEAELAGLIADLKAAGNVAHLDWVETLAEGSLSLSGAYRVQVELADSKALPLREGG